MTTFVLQHEVGHCATKVVPRAHTLETIDWAQIEEWDREYYLHNTASGSEMAYLGVERVDGNYIYLANGCKLLDFQSQLISDSLGHRHPAPHAAIQSAMERYGHVFFGMGTDLRARAAKLLIEDVLDGKAGWAGRVRFMSSGSEACEIATQVARLYTQRPLLMTQAHSYHGLTSGPTLLRGYRGNLTELDNGQFRGVRDVPNLLGSGHIPIPPPEHQDFQCNGVLPSILATEQLILACGPENIAALITEPMFGAAGLMPHTDYYPLLFALMKKYDILWIDDEVLCGMGRLGKWFGYQLSPEIHPDIMIVGKGLNGSSLPSGGVITNHKISEVFEEGRWWSGSTWDAHPLVCASILGTLEFMLESDVLAIVKTRGKYLQASLGRLKEKHPCIGRVSGAGLYYVLDLVNLDGDPIIPADRFSSFEGDLSIHPNNIVGSRCMEQGVFLGGFVPNSVKCGPPFTITENEIDLAMEALSVSLEQVESVHH